MSTIIVAVKDLDQYGNGTFSFANTPETPQQLRERFTINSDSGWLSINEDNGVRYIQCRRGLLYREERK